MEQTPVYPPALDHSRHQPQQQYARSPYSSHTEQAPFYPPQYQQPPHLQGDPFYRQPSHHRQLQQDLEHQQMQQTPVYEQWQPRQHHRELQPHWLAQPSFYLRPASAYAQPIQYQQPAPPTPWLGQPSIHGPSAPYQQPARPAQPAQPAPWARQPSVYAQSTPYQQHQQPAQSAPWLGQPSPYAQLTPYQQHQQPAPWAGQPSAYAQSTPHSHHQQPAPPAPPTPWVGDHPARAQSPHQPHHQQHQQYARPAPPAPPVHSISRLVEYDALPARPVVRKRATDQSVVHQNKRACSYAPLDEDDEDDNNYIAEQAGDHQQPLTENQRRPRSIDHRPRLIDDPDGEAHERDDGTATSRTRGGGFRGLGIRAVRTVRPLQRTTSITQCFTLLTPSRLALVPRSY